MGRDMELTGNSQHRRYQILKQPSSFVDDVQTLDYHMISSTYRDSAHLEKSCRGHQEMGVECPPNCLGLERRYIEWNKLKGWKEVMEIAKTVYNDKPIRIHCRVFLEQLITLNCPGASVLDANVIRLESNIRNSLKNWRRKEIEKKAHLDPLLQLGNESQKSNSSSSSSSSSDTMPGKREWTSMLTPWKEGEQGLDPPRPLLSPHSKLQGTEVLEHKDEEVEEDETPHLCGRKRASSPRVSSQVTKHSKRKDPRLDINFLLAAPGEKDK